MVSLPVGGRESLGGHGAREHHDRHHDRQRHAGDAFCHRFHRIIPSLKRMTWTTTYLRRRVTCAT